MKRALKFCFLFFFTLSAALGREKLSDSDLQKVRNIFKENESLHWSFFHYDKKKVEEHAQKVSQAISHIKNEKLLEFLNRSQKKLNALKASQDQKKNNKLYFQASKDFIRVLKKFDIGSDYNAYSCPMIHMSWVQNSKVIDKVHNPFASYMPHCGTKDTQF